MSVHIVPQNSHSITTEVDHARLALPSTRERIVLQPGAEVAIGARHYRISQILDLETVLPMIVSLGSQDSATRE